MGQNTCNFITEFGVIFIFAKIEGCGQKNIREIKILFDNSLIVSGVPETIKELLNDMTNFTIKWLTVIFDRLSGLISRIIREIKILLLILKCMNQNIVVLYVA